MGVHIHVSIWTPHFLFPLLSIYLFIYLFNTERVRESEQMHKQEEQQAEEEGEGGF